MGVGSNIKRYVAEHGGGEPATADEIILGESNDTFISPAKLYESDAYARNNKSTAQEIIEGASDNTIVTPAALYESEAYSRNKDVKGQGASGTVKLLGPPEVDQTIELYPGEIYIAKEGAVGAYEVEYSADYDTALENLRAKAEENPLFGTVIKEEV